MLDKIPIPLTTSNLKRIQQMHKQAEEAEKAGIKQVEIESDEDAPETFDSEKKVYTKPSKKKGK